MGNFFSAVGKAIVTAVKVAIVLVLKGGELVYDVVTTPVIWLAETIFGQSQQPQLQAPTKAAFDPGQLAKEHEMHELKEAKSRLAAEPNALAYMAACMPREERLKLDMGALEPKVASWIRCLTDSEAMLAKKAGLQGCLDHIAGRKMIPGVFRVKEPIAIEWMERAASPLPSHDLDRDFDYQPSPRFARSM